MAGFAARWRRALRRPIVRRKDAADVVGDDHRSAARPGHASAAARNACGPARLPAEATL